MGDAQTLVRAEGVLRMLSFRPLDHRRAGWVVRGWYLVTLPRWHLNVVSHDGGSRMGMVTT